MSVILPAVSISVSTRSNCDDLNQPRDPDVSGVAKRSWKWNGGMGEWKLGKKMSKQIFIFPRKSGRKKTGAEAAGRHVSRAVISFFMAGYTLPSFSSNLVQRAIFGREAWFTRRHKNASRCRYQTSFARFQNFVERLFREFVAPSFFTFVICSTNSNENEFRMLVW